MSSRISSKNKSKSKGRQARAKFFTIEDIAKGYLALNYSCAILGINANLKPSKKTSQRYPGFTNYLVDGFPYLTFKKVNIPTTLTEASIERYNVLFIAGQILPNDARFMYDLHQIRTMFIAKLQNKNITVSLPKNSDILSTAEININ